MVREKVKLPRYRAPPPQPSPNLSFARVPGAVWVRREMSFHGTCGVSVTLRAHAESVWRYVPSGGHARVAEENGYGVALDGGR